MVVDPTEAEQACEFLKYKEKVFEHIAAALRDGHPIVPLFGSGVSVAAGFPLAATLSNYLVRLHWWLKLNKRGSVASYLRGHHWPSRHDLTGQLFHKYDGTKGTFTDQLDQNEFDLNREAIVDEMRREAPTAAYALEGGFKYLAKLQAGGPLPKTFERAYDRATGKIHSYTGYRSLLNFLCDRDGDLIDAFFDHFSRGQRTSTTHQFIAFATQLLGSRLILTTNFDPYIEASLRAEGMKPTVYEINRDGSPPSAQLIHSQQLSLVKLHGGAFSLRTGFDLDERLSPGVLAQYREYFRPASPGAKPPLVIAIGYSGSDRRVMDILGTHLADWSPGTAKRDANRDAKRGEPAGASGPLPRLIWVSRSGGAPARLNEIARPYYAPSESPGCRSPVAVCTYRDGGHFLHELYQTLTNQHPVGRGHYRALTPIARSPTTDGLPFLEGMKRRSPRKPWIESEHSEERPAEQFRQLMRDWRGMLFYAEKPRTGSSTMMAQACQAMEDTHTTIWIDAAEVRCRASLFMLMERTFHVYDRRLIRVTRPMFFGDIDYLAREFPKDPTGVEKFVDDRDRAIAARWIGNALRRGRYVLAIDSLGEFAGGHPAMRRDIPGTTGPGRNGHAPVSLDTNRDKQFSKAVEFLKAVIGPDCDIGESKIFLTAVGHGPNTAGINRFKGHVAAFENLANERLFEATACFERASRACDRAQGDTRTTRQATRRNTTLAKAKAALQNAQDALGAARSRSALHLHDLNNEKDPSTIERGLFAKLCKLRRPGAGPATAIGKRDPGAVWSSRIELDYQQSKVRALVILIASFSRRGRSHASLVTMLQRLPAFLKAIRVPLGQDLRLILDAYNKRDEWCVEQFRLQTGEFPPEGYLRDEAERAKLAIRLAIEMDADPANATASAKRKEHFLVAEEGGFYWMHQETRDEVFESICEQSLLTARQIALVFFGMADFYHEDVYERSQDAAAFMEYFFHRLMSIRWEPGDTKKSRNEQHARATWLVSAIELEHEKLLARGMQTRLLNHIRSLIALLVDLAGAPALAKFGYPELLSRTLAVYADLFVSCGHTFDALPYRLLQIDLLDFRIEQATSARTARSFANFWPKATRSARSLRCLSQEASRDRVADATAKLEAHALWLSHQLDPKLTVPLSLPLRSIVGLARETVDLMIDAGVTLGEPAVFDATTQSSEFDSNRGWESPEAREFRIEQTCALLKSATSHAKIVSGAAASRVDTERVARASIRLLEHRVQLVDHRLHPPATGDAIPNVGVLDDIIEQCQIARESIRGGSKSSRRRRQKCYLFLCKARAFSLKGEWNRADVSFGRAHAALARSAGAAERNALGVVFLYHAETQLARAAAERAKDEIVGSGRLLREAELFLNQAFDSMEDDARTENRWRTFHSCLAAKLAIAKASVADLPADTRADLYFEATRHVVAGLTNTGLRSDRRLVFRNLLVQIRDAIAGDPNPEPGKNPYKNLRLRAGLSAETDPREKMFFERFVKAGE